MERGMNGREQLKDCIKLSLQYLKACSLLLLLNTRGYTHTPLRLAQTYVNMLNVFHLAS